ncbi:BTB domain-containing protein [Mycena chlorophos]|uniref:BTB domain-containing protein n=1 Tax=Mycena chlorophos TaxID=658473 RepID=A0A8H6VYH7_MYCCL|nr:BTB domain-containing protein [Mycena chlorophos]
MADAPVSQSNERPSKRARPIPESDADAPVQRSNTYWFDDGNVILQVESTQFRISKGVLAMHSPVFRDMFSLPLPSNEPLVENCPVVLLAGDRSEDWLYLLDAIFPAEYRVEEKPAFAELAGVLRLSKKYDIDAFRRGCLRRLKAEYPDSLAEHSALPKEVEAALSTLRAEDRAACVLGHLKMIAAYTPHRWLKPEIHIPCADCVQSDECDSARQDVLLKQAIAPLSIIGALFDEWDDDWSEDLCEACTRRAKQIFKETQEACWAKLPSYFGLPDWDELRRLDIE